MPRIIVFGVRCERRALAALRRIVAAVLGVGLAGCSMPIAGFVDPTPTGAVKSKTYPFAEEDWPKAEAALMAAIRADASEDPARWSNSASGRRGAIAGIGSRYELGGATCRAFVAKIGDDSDTHAAQGAACVKSGAVTISDAAPFRGL